MIHYCGFFLYDVVYFEIGYWEIGFCWGFGKGGIVGGVF
jgi:hypothetical protein